MCLGDICGVLLINRLLQAESSLNAHQDSCIEMYINAFGKIALKAVFARISELIIGF